MASTADDTRQSPPLGSPSQGSVDGVDPYSDHAARILDSAYAAALLAAARTGRDEAMPLGDLHRRAVRGLRPADIVLADRKLTITWQEPIHISRLGLQVGVKAARTVINACRPQSGAFLSHGNSVRLLFPLIDDR